MTQFDKTYKFMKNPWTLLSSSILVVLLFIFVDRPTASYFHQLDLHTKMPIWHWITIIGKWQIYVALFFIMGLFFRFVVKNPLAEKRSWFLFLCIVASNFLCFVLKISLSRARPELLFANQEYGFYWFQLKDLYWSMPSGHALTISTLAAGLGVLFPSYYFLFFLVFLLVCASRIFLTFHYLSDVFTGFYLGVLVVGFIAHYLRSNYDTQIKGYKRST